MTVEQKADNYALKNKRSQGSSSFGELSNYFDLKKGFIDGYHECQKEHEWHYVKDGDLPKHDHEVLCILWGDTREIGYYKNEVWYFENFSADNEDVDYWQEIVPPKEIE